MSTLTKDAAHNREQYEALVSGRHDDPFALLGLHHFDKARVVRVYQPHALQVELLDSKSESLGVMERVHDAGLFVAVMPPRKRRYRLKVTDKNNVVSVIEDCYRFKSLLGEMDLHLLGEGRDNKIYEKLGAHVKVNDKISGVNFAVWAPGASRVSVVGDFNDWDGRQHVMRRHPGTGIWEIFIPSIGSGAQYKFELLDQNGKLLPLKTDPFGNYHEAPPGNASIVFESFYQWQDSEWINNRSVSAELAKPISIYEVHLGSWRRKSNGGSLSYRELADELVNYVTDMGFTHIEFLPLTEHPFDGSWGYQPIGMFAPTQRFGDPDELRHLIDSCHAAGIAVIIDWVPAHFPRDEHGLSKFDGTALYEHEDPRKGAHADWGTLIFNYGRHEVINYLIGSALYWIEEFHIDAIRVDAVASMLYLDYSREDGEWIPNEHGGNENYEAIEFLKRLNTEVHARGALSFAEESTAWPAVSRPVEHGGLGFTFKWNMGWMNDSLQYISEDPLHRAHHHDKITFSLVYAFNENFVLPLSHDEVVHGKGSLMARMPGDDWQKFANLRAYLTFMYGHPGKKLLFMGTEIAQHREWNHDTSLDWHLLENEAHSGTQSLMKELNAVYKENSALHQIDFSNDGFEWIDWGNREDSVLSWLRRDRQDNAVLCITNFTPVVRHEFRLGVPCAGKYICIFNSDDTRYGGSGAGTREVEAEKSESHGRDWSIVLDLPPLATVYFKVA